MVEEPYADDEPRDPDPTLEFVPEVVHQPIKEDEPRDMQRTPYVARFVSPNNHQTTPNLKELVDHYQFLKAKSDNGQILSKEEAWEVRQIYAVLSKAGYTMYLS